MPCAAQDQNIYPCRARLLPVSERKAGGRTPGAVIVARLSADMPGAVRFHSGSAGIFSGDFCDVAPQGEFPPFGRDDRRP
jgi:hypothetical protein